MQSKKCLFCGKTFFKTSNLSQIIWETTRKFCSVKCRAKGLPSPKKGKIYPHLWKDKVTYGALHLQVYKKFGKPKKCVKCGSVKNIEWANKSNKYEDINDFMALCVSCHKKYDNKINGNIPWNKGRKTGLIPWNKGLHVRLNPSGEFKKGHIPWNKGIPNSGFKRGYTPWNKKVVI